MSRMFRYEKWPPSAHRHAVHHLRVYWWYRDTKKGKLKNKNINACVSYCLSFSGASTVYTMSAPGWWHSILTLLLFLYIDRIKWIFGHKLVTEWAAEVCKWNCCYNSWSNSKKIEKSPSESVSFCRVYFVLISFNLEKDLRKHNTYRNFYELLRSGWNIARQDCIKQPSLLFEYGILSIN